MEKLKDKRFNLSSLTNYRSIFMGLAIISIIIFHYTDDCRIYHYNFNGFVKLYNYYISSSGVDLFLLLSGFGLFYSLKNNSCLKDFYKKRFVKLLIPYFIFCFPALIWKYMIFNDYSFLEVIKQFSFYSFFNNGDRWFWYICMISICYFFFPYLFRLFDSEVGNIHIKFISLLCCFFLFNLLLQLYYPKLFFNIEVMTLRFVPFILGTYIGKLSYDKKELSILDIISIFILLLFVFMLRPAGNVIFVRSSVFAILLFFSFFLVFFLEFISKTKFFSFFKKIFEKIGEYTLELYLTHVCIRTVLCSYGYLTCHIRYYFLVVVASIILSILLKNICSFLSKRILNG